MEKVHILGFIFFALLCAQFRAVAAADNVREAKALDKLRPLVSEFLVEDLTKEDAFLIRFLRARELDVGRARDMLIASLRWRKENGICNILNTTFEAERALPYTLNAVDKEGGPVLFIPFGAWDMRRFVLAGKTAEVIRVLHKAFEKTLWRTREVSKAVGRDLITATYLGDVAGYNLRKHGCLGCFRIYVEITTALENHYPQLYKHMIVVNGPRIFTSVVDLVKPILSEFTRKGIEVFPANKAEWSKAVLKIIPQDQVELAMGRKL